MGGTLVKTDIGHGRGWLAPAPAASLRRIDVQLGRPADINEAGRSPEQANANRARWLAYERYLNGGPWAPKAPYALGADESVHCWGYAADTDDSYDPIAAGVWLDNGWVQTALYPNNPAKHEPWHREYREDRDNHRNDPAPAGNIIPLPKGKTMADVKQIHWMNGSKVGGRALIIPGTPWAVPFTESGATYANASAKQFQTGSSVEYTKSLFDAFLAAAGRCAPTTVRVEVVNADG